MKNVSPHIAVIANAHAQRRLAQRIEQSIVDLIDHTQSKIMLAAHTGIRVNISLQFSSRRYPIIHHIVVANI